MSALKSLTFTTLPKIGANPTLDRRTNMIARLEEQKVLLKDPNYIRTVRTWAKKDGRLTLVDKQQRVLPWWRVDANGSYVFFVRLGSKPIEFEKGKNAIAVPSFDKIPFVINIVITAVRNGELDDQSTRAGEEASDGCDISQGGVRTISDETLIKGALRGQLD